MRRLLRFFTSRYFTSIFFVFLQIIAIILFLTMLSGFGSWFFLTTTVFSIIAIIAIVNDDNNPETRLTWTAVVALLPGIGVVLYVIFGRVWMKKKDRRYMKGVEKELAPYLKQVANLDDIRDSSPDLYNNIKLLENTATMPIRNYTDACYFSSGETYFENLVEEIKKAEKFIFIESFIIKKGTMWNSVRDILVEKVKNGVEVCIMYDDVGSITSLRSDYYRRLKKLGLRCVIANRITGHLSAFQNYRDHRKIVIIDGVIGYTGGCNFGDEYINVSPRFGHWKDGAIKITGDAVDNLTVIFIEQWNYHCKKRESKLEVEKYVEMKECVHSSNSIIVPFGSGPKPFYKNQVANDLYLNIINNATKTLYITTPYLICGYEVFNAIKLAAKRGVKVKIITPHIPDKKIVFILTRSNYKMLIDEGVEIYEYTPGFIHSKMIIADDITGVCGTINLDYRSLKYHFESGAFIYNDKSITEMSDDFNKTIEKCEKIVKIKQNLVQKTIRNILKLFVPVF